MKKVNLSDIGSRCADSKTISRVYSLVASRLRKSLAEFIKSRRASYEKDRSDVCTLAQLMHRHSDTRKRKSTLRWRRTRSKREKCAAQRRKS